jgi:catechol 2,3-dioxygenase-like lactoylglutathione lyase family enzyme
MNIVGTRVEFIEYKDPKSQPYHKNPSFAGSAHLASRVDNIEETRKRMEEAGVEFHSPINSFMESGEVEWKWCYFRDPDGITLELVEQKRKLDEKKDHNSAEDASMKVKGENRVVNS